MEFGKERQMPAHIPEAEALSELRESPPKTIADLNLGPLWEVRVVQWIRGEQKMSYNHLSDEKKTALRNEATRLTVQDGIGAIERWRKAHDKPYVSMMPTAISLLNQKLKERGIIKAKIRSPI